MATLTLQNWHANDDGSPRAGATVTYKAASASEPNANPVLGTTTTNASGRWQFTGVADGDYDVYLADGVTVRFWKGLAALPLSFAKAPVGPVANALTNGDLSVWQQGTSFVSPASSAFTADRWQWVVSGAAVVTIARSTDVPTVGANAINTPYSLYVDVTTADAAIAAGDFAYLRNVIEGFDYRALTNGFTCSFWVKGAKTGIHAVSFMNKGFDRAYVAEYTISAANTWEYKTVVVSTPPTAGTWDYTTGAGLYVHFPLMAGSTYHTTKDAWQTGAFLSTAAAVNEVDNAANDFRIALVNVIPGSTAAPLVPLPYEVQLARCQRYYQLLSSATTDVVGSGLCISTTHAYIARSYFVEMGGAPTITVTTPGSFALYTATGATQAATAIGSVGPSARATTLDVTVASGIIGGNGTALIQGGAGSIAAAWNPT